MLILHWKQLSSCDYVMELLELYVRVIITRTSQYIVCIFIFEQQNMFAGFKLILKFYIHKYVISFVVLIMFLCIRKLVYAFVNQLWTYVY